MYTKVATRDINFGILIKIPHKVELDLPQISRRPSKNKSEFIFLCLVSPSKLSFWANLEGKTRQRKMNSGFFFDGRRDIQGKSSSTFWGIFIKIPKLISRVATLMYTLFQTLCMSALATATATATATLMYTLFQTFCMSALATAHCHRLCRVRKQLGTSEKSPIFFF